MSNRGKWILAAVVALLLLGAGLGLYFRYWFVYAEGTDAGELNYFARQGVVFKTYEGKMIQTGLKGAKAAQAGVQSNEFVFSVEEERIADSLMHCAGKQMTLHYKRYKGTLPWRGKSEFVVDSIWTVEK